MVWGGVCDSVHILRLRKKSRVLVNGWDLLVILGFAVLVYFVLLLTD